MIEMISKVVAAVALVVSSFLILKNIFSESKNILSIKNIFLLILFVVLTVFLHNTNYSPLAPIMIYLIMIIIYKNMFSLAINKTILVTGIVMIMYFISDLFTTIIFLNFVDINALRSIPIVIILSNFIVSVVAISFSFINPLMSKIRKFIKIVENNKYYDKLLFTVLVTVVLSLVVYNLSITSSLNKEYIINISIMGFFFLLMFVFIGEKNQKDKLNDEYDRLMEYVENFEDWIEDEKLNSHEHKNQLAVIRGLVKKNKKAVEYIDNIIQDDIYLEDFWINEIKHLPTGGIKGLLYYKLILTKKENIDICLSVSRDVKNFIKDVDSIELKNIYRLLGIYLDNAIEAAKESDNKVISLEIYPMNSRLMIVISNTYKGKIDINKIKNKGYTTKGSGHGNGLYYADKIIKKSSILESESSIINNYYIQKLMIIKKEI